MKDQWTEINELRRVYLMPDLTEVVIDNPRALFISKSRTHYVSNDNDTERIIVQWPFDAIHITVAESQNWTYPPPRFTNKNDGTRAEVDEAIKRLTQRKTIPCINGPWATPDLFKDGE